MGIYLKAAVAVACLVLSMGLFVLAIVGACQFSPILGVALEFCILLFGLFGLLVKLQKDCGEF